MKRNGTFINCVTRKIRKPIHRDIDSLVRALVNTNKLVLATTTTTYKLVSYGKDLDLDLDLDLDPSRMLSWNSPIAIQMLPEFGLARVGTIGDGNCLLHSILFATSPTYRALKTSASKSVVANGFRNELRMRIGELRDLADVLYPEFGGAVGFDEIFVVLRKKYSYLNIEMGNLIARLYGYNLLAVQVVDTITLRPVNQTFVGFDPDAPTILVNFLGSARLDFRDKVTNKATNKLNDEYNGMGSHFEILVETSMSQSQSQSKSQHPFVILDESTTNFVLGPRSSRALAKVLGLFSLKGGWRHKPKARRHQTRQKHVSRSKTTSISLLESVSFSRLGS